MLKRLSSILLALCVCIMLGNVCLAQLDDSYDNSNLEENGTLNSPFAGDEMNTNVDPDSANVIDEENEENPIPDDGSLLDEMEAGD